MLPFIIKSCGAFFYQKKPYRDSKLYRIIFDKYIELLLKQGNTLEFFIEGTRSRTGKILAPNFEILNVVLDTVIYGKVSDICLIPMTVNYEKVLEGTTFPGELLGDRHCWGKSNFYDASYHVPLIIRQPGNTARAGAEVAAAAGAPKLENALYPDTDDTG